MARLSNARERRSTLCKNLVPPNLDGRRSVAEQALTQVHSLSRGRRERRAVEATEERVLGGLEHRILLSLEWQIEDAEATVPFTISPGRSPLSP
jgi:hypothetical protein